MIKTRTGYTVITTSTISEADTSYDDGTLEVLLAVLEKNQKAQIKRLKAKSDGDRTITVVPLPVEVWREDDDV